MPKIKKIYKRGVLDNPKMPRLKKHTFDKEIRNYLVKARELNNGKDAENLGTALRILRMTRDGAHNVFYSMFLRQGMSRELAQKNAEYCVETQFDKK
ncbi:MAG: hypothetical protein Q7S21_07120 [archaeon]|nr:hypothetical protein [archaeon]